MSVLFKNLLTAFLSLTLVFGGAELGIRLFASGKIKTHFDDQAERGLGSPAPPKEAGEYRIAIFGGSAAYGFPVADKHSITAWLRKSFPFLLPGREVKVINAAWPGKGSQHVVEGARALLKYEPDLFIVYSGHNEFPTTNRLYLDNRLYWLNLRLYFRSAFYRFLSKRLSRLRKKIVYGSSGYAEKQYREEVIAQKVYKRAEIDERDYERILNRYRENMESVIKFAKRNAIDMIFLTLASNLRDIPPQVSQEVSGPSEAERQYERAQVLERAGKYEAAKKAYVLARDRDPMPWRAKSSMNDVIRELGRRHDLILVDVVRVFERLSAHGIISSELIYDNVHPSFKGQQIIADEILRALWRHGKIAAAREWQWGSFEKTREEDARGDWKAGDAVNAYRYVLKGLYLWGEKHYAESAADLEKGLELMPDFIESYAFLGDAYVHLNQKEKGLWAFRTLAQKDQALSEFLLEKYPEIRQSYRSLQAPQG